MGSTTTYYIGNYYEKTGTTETKYYYEGGARVAMRTAGAAYFMLTDQLGSSTVTLTSTGSQYGKLLYYPWGEVRYSTGSVPTSFRYTGQFEYDTIAGGIMYYGARYYDNSLGRWLQPDSVIPDQYNPQSYDRYAYVRNNPVNRIDPTGHRDEGPGMDLIDNDITVTTHLAQQEKPDELDYAWENKTFMYDGEYTWWIKYRSVTFGTAIPNQYTGTLVGWHITITEDQYGEWYIGGGVDLGKSPLLVNFSFVNGQMNQYDLPLNQQDEPGFLEDFISGHAIQVYIVPILDIQLNFSLGKGMSYDLGFGTPQGGTAWTYLFHIP